ncbi:MAG: putative zinc transporter msc2 [Peltula sp. TS41687]|nr:MAG: putative zinc transporter msc2 [Peltula sp. TS41687]
MTSIGPFPMNGDPSRTHYDHVDFYHSPSQSEQDPATPKHQLSSQNQLASNNRMVSQQEDMAANIPNFFGEQPSIYPNDRIDDDDSSDDDSDIPPHAHGTHLQVPPAHVHMVADPGGKDENLSLATNTAAAYPEGNSYVYTGYTPRSRSGTASSGVPQSSGWFFQEVLTGFLIPLPYLLFASVFRGNHPVQLLASYATSSAGFNTCGALEATAITAATFTSIGAIGLVAEKIDSRQEKAQSLGRDHVRRGSVTAISNFESARSVLARGLGVGLPLYSTLKLGGSRVAIVLLTMSALPSTNDDYRDISVMEGWKRFLIMRKATVASLVLGIACDAMLIVEKTDLKAVALGYLTLAISVLVFQPPFPSISRISPVSKSQSFSGPLASAVKSIRGDTPSFTETPATQVSKSPLITTPDDLKHTLMTGIILGVMCIMSTLLLPHLAVDTYLVRWPVLLLAVAFLAGMLLLVQPSILQTQRKIGLALGLSSTVLYISTSPKSTWKYGAIQASVGLASYLAVAYDTNTVFKWPRRKSHGHEKALKFTVLEAGHGHTKQSWFTRSLLGHTQRWPLLHSILAERDSRRIFYFMCLNFGFMLVQTFYGIATGSLGLLSDSIHMLFDCLALFVGLCAAVMSKWPPSMRFPYGLGKMDTLAGFANGIFLMLISVEIVTEAIERLVTGSQMKRLGELLTVSTLGLGVNLIGILAFDHAHHGHGHSHGGGGHQHDHHHDAHTHGHQEEHSHEQQQQQQHHHHHHHSPHSHGHSPDSHSAGTPQDDSQYHHHHHHTHGHGHVHSHSHGHGNENMHGIFLHILADTLGSVAVVISTLLIHFYKWPGFDPLASCLIAILIFASAIPLVTSSARTLLLTIPADTEYGLRETLTGVSGLRGVAGYCVPKFWLGDGDGDGVVLGVIHVLVMKGVENDEVRARVVDFLKGRGVDAVVQVEREGEGRCWCGGGLGPGPRSTS